MVEFGKDNHRKFRKLGFLKNGVPSEATLCRMECQIDDEELEKVLQTVADSFEAKEFKIKGLDIVSLDGKCLRGTTHANGRNPDVVSLYSAAKGISTCTEMCSEKSNEIPAARRLIGKTDINGKTLTADAMFCQKDIMEQIMQQGGHFLIEIKGNQKTLRWNAEDRIGKARPLDFYEGQPELSHGRIETRCCSTFCADEIIDTGKWGKALTIVKIDKSTTIKSTGERTDDSRYLISDLQCNAKDFNTLARAHWGIETNHWILDKVMHEDQTKRKKVCAGRNNGTLMRLCFAIVTIKTKRRKSVKDRRLAYTNIFNKLQNKFTLVKRLLF